ncbi:MAG: GNAT family N-acetyltransferase [Atopobiaceae bacterium]|nr:GNAT family N-acetyltransferase [Atopobiaceae bacterium]MCH4180250.1 GNAT family N-acetyltransferase [Atopobiaceae bacterium]MCH4214736.1 GNAT family N-acetyltransferase [Atopobiaceae bacterium]MCH4229149.1 GNAT family N-acetyltransferase [Atopobiaceae bacterium]MCH4276520.1 GNAT family N-acetyltransferase [Atopobiaceae bacterium]
MGIEDIDIRMATIEDAPALLAIYAPYVTETAISFECQVPSVDEFTSRMEATFARYPYLVAELSSTGRPVGYAYTSAFVGRAAYDWSAETSIYVDRRTRHHGVGGALYQVLEAASRAQGILNLNACIGYPAEAGDGHLTTNSVDFHAHLGYSMVGRFHASGYKFGTWYDMVWMEKMLGPHPSEPTPFVPFPCLPASARATLAL